MYHKLKGIVIREAPKGEAGKLLTVLTDNIGVITVNAKGVRKISAAFLKSAQLFAFSEMLLYVKNGYYTLTEASLISDFYPIREDIKKYALACYIGEAASAFAAGPDSADVLRLVLNSLYALEKDMAEPDHIKSAFELRLCAECGFAPELHYCASCGEELKGNCIFSVEEGIAVCPKCTSSSNGGAVLNENVRKAICHITDLELNKFISFRIPEPDKKILAEYAEKYLLLRAERGFKTLSFYKHCEELK